MSRAETHERLANALKDSADGLLSIVVERLVEGVVSRMPHLVDVFLETGDVAEWEAGLQDAVQDSLISMALVMEAKKQGLGVQAAARELSVRVHAIVEGMK